MNTFDLHQVAIGYEQKIVLDDLTFSIPHGKITVLLGANGCGKSTLLSTLARQRDALGGTIAFRDKPLTAYRAKEAARLMAFMPQVNVAPDGLTVEQLVRFGRYPYQTFFKRYSEDDERAVERALAFTDTVSLRDTLVSNLSGGQKQRVWIALALAQESETILLDEPTTYLDMSHQIEILDLMYRLNRLEGKTIIMVLHDLHLACRYADHVIALAGGNVYRQGSPNDVVDEAFMQDVFGLKVVARMIANKAATAAFALAAAVVGAGVVSGCAEPKEPMSRAQAHWSQCSPCHGDNGQGKHAQLAPPIAGLPAWYVETQLNHYKADIRGNAYDDLPGLRMRPMAMALLTEQDVKEMAAYVESLPTPPAQVAAIDGYGPNAASAYAVCVACHQADGSGNKALNAPPIAGAPDWYVYEQLRKFKHGLRGADPKDVTGQQMRAIALGLGDDKALHDLARYVADMPVKRPH